MKIAVIPARGKSKRIPRKNIRSFLGKPIIAWVIQSAIRSNCFDEVVVSTDDHEISEIAKIYGASVPFIRPDHLSDDHTGTSDVIRHAIQWFDANGKVPEYICCMYATAPFIISSDIIRSLNILIENRVDYVFSVSRYSYPIQRALGFTNDKKVKLFFPSFLESRSQDLNEAFHDAGQFYWGTRDAWISKKAIVSGSTIPFFLPEYQVQDIDNEDDWRMAEFKFKAFMNGKY